jgi:hypothetical protein
MTEVRCPLCEAVLQLPDGPPEPETILNGLAEHFSQSCTGVQVQRAEATEERPSP